jgi:site-specific DNA-methyltransferase (adenine-specific)
VANAVLDLLPPEVWADPALRWLDPGCKTGIFPREITKRLMVGLADAFPDEVARLEHILTNMVFAIAITQITGLMSRRTLYCSKDASSEYSVVRFESKSGNVWQQRADHTFDKGRCTECGGSQVQLENAGRDNYAYGFIHSSGRANIEKEMSMRFDVIVGNPPYQMDADAEGKNVNPLYNTFVEQAIALNPRYLSMIIPSRWMQGGKGLDQFRSTMLGDNRIRYLTDLSQMKSLFPGVDFEGGVCYFLWDRDNPGLCQSTYFQGEISVEPVERNLNEFDTYVRDPRALPILHKVRSKDEPSFADLVSTRDPFGPALQSNFTGYRKSDKKQAGDLKLYMNVSNARAERWVDAGKVTRNYALVKKWKIFISKAYGERGAVPARVLGPTIVAGPNSVCTATYLCIGPFESKKASESAETYLQTRFARFLVSLRLSSQNSTQKSYGWLPQQKWDRTWTDEELYKEYDISEEEQAFIEAMVKEIPA